MSSSTLAPKQSGSPRASSAPPALMPQASTGTVLPLPTATEVERQAVLAKYAYMVEEHIKHKKFGFTHDDALRFAAQAVKFVTSLNISTETEARFSLAPLPMYDLAILIDDSTSMKFDDGGERVKTLQQVLHVITHFYALSQPDGKIKAVRFMNRRPGLDNATPEEIMEHISKHRYEGMTRIGKELEKKILRPFVSKQMTRPLLVMIITDGDIDGEPVGYLQEVIKTAVEQLLPSHDNFVTFQFSRIGNDPGAESLLQALDDHKDLAQYIDTMPVDTTFEKMSSLLGSEQVQMIAKLMIGAISDTWDDFEL